ncbi:hypothetical protein DPMN_130124 [Dreissena polymorpha]|uniref:S1-like RNA binding domain-containing protein n=1 Tax=Dreissena polymorpha TaxID=45954 RepID=A0A9D4JY42_DREPO|nr:hypothetical protein DPMN_130124 [Dreissena polymorpha]
MFSAAGKVLSYLFGETQSTDDLHTDDVHTDDPCEPTVSTEQALERREFEGAVSHVFSGHGLIDSEVYFSLDQVVGGMRPAVGDSVHVSAVRQNAGGGWHAEKVSITTEWEENDDGGIQGSVPTELVGMVTSTSKQTGYVNKNVYYNLAECQLADYVPSKGDWVKVKVTYQGEGQMDPVATEMEPLRRMEDDGVVSADMGDHGYINGEVFYTSAALLDGFMPRKWETVRFSAVESDQGKCKWRAVSVKASEKPQLASLKVFQGPLQKSFTQELLADKEGICITEKTDFGQVTMGTSKTLTVVREEHWVHAKEVCQMSYDRLWVSDCNQGY